MGCHRLLGRTRIVCQKRTSLTCSHKNWAPTMDVVLTSPCITKNLSFLNCIKLGMPPTSLKRMSLCSAFLPSKNSHRRGVPGEPCEHEPLRRGPLLPHLQPQELPAHLLFAVLQAAELWRRPPWGWLSHHSRWSPHQPHVPWRPLGTWATASWLQPQEEWDRS